MTLDVPNWQHKSGYSIKADGQQIIYEHTEMPWKAVIEGVLAENEEPPFDFQYYVAIFDKSTNFPTKTIEAHEFFAEKENAIEDLESKMKKHS